MLGDLLLAAGFGFSKLGLGKLGEVESLGKEEAAPLVGDLQRFFFKWPRRGYMVMSEQCASEILVEVCL